MLQEDALGETRDEIYKLYLEVALSNRVSEFIKGGVILKPNWMADGSSFFYAEQEEEKTIIYKINPEKKTKEPLFDNEGLRKALTLELGHEPSGKGIPFSQFEFLEGERRVKFMVEGKEFLLDLKTHEIQKLPPLSEEEKNRKKFLIPKQFKAFLGNETKEILSPGGKFFAGIKDFNLYLRSTEDNTILFLTDEGREGYAWDLWNASPLWSPDGSRLILTKVDWREMPKIPLVNWLKQREDVDWVIYSKAGESLWKSELYVIDINSKKKVKIEIGDLRNHFISIVDWLPQGEEFLFFIVDREFKKLELMKANAFTGVAQKILTETEETQLHLDPFQRMEIKFLEGGRKFIWMSERDGWNHLYLYETGGRLIRRLTEGNFPVSEIKKVDEKRGWVYFMAQVDQTRPYDLHLCRVNLRNGKFERLTEAQGEHLIHISPSSEFFLDVHSSLTRPPKTELRTSEGKHVMVITEARIDVLNQKLKWVPPEEFTVKAADGETLLYGVIFKPYDFNPSKKYPILDYIYNVPHATIVPRNMYSALLTPEAAFAQLGFILFMLDGRGTSGRGKAFQDASYGKLGQIEIADHVAGLKQLAEQREYIDLNRVGIYGISYGGYLTLRAMLVEPDFFKVGVATAPMVDPEEIMSYTEHYLGLPQKNKKAYQESSCLHLAPRLQGRLLLIHGTKDQNAPFSGTIKMAEALIRAGKPFEMLILPEEAHVPSGIRGKYWIMYQHRYLEENLKDFKAPLPFWEKRIR